MARRRAEKSSRTERRLFLREAPAEGQEFLLDGPRKRYICDVLRMRAGDPLILFDGSGWQYRAVLLGVTRRQAQIRVQGRLKAQTESPIRILLGIGLLKAQKMDLVIQKTSELGVTEVVPVQASRAVPLLTSERSQARRGRWQRIAQEASRQSGRTEIPEIKPVAAFEEILAQAEEADLSLLFTPATSLDLDEAAKHVQTHPNRILLLVGPEGGFSPAEEEMAMRKGFLLVGLGPRTLRAETAAILAVGLVQYQFGDL